MFLPPGTKFLIKEFLITGFLKTKYLIDIVPNHFVPVPGTGMFLPLHFVS
jgi:hypothetical protein